jgi:diguanylate cyclase (GGDEF)-like protein
MTVRQTPSLESLIVGAMALLGGVVLIGWLRAPADLLSVAQVLAFAALVGAVVLYRARSRRDEELRQAQEAGLTRMLQGLSRSTSSDAIVEAIVTDLLRTARADHVVVIGRRSAEGPVEATLVSAAADVAPAKVQLPSDALEVRPASGGAGGAGALRVQLARRVRTMFGLANTLAAPLVAEDEVVGALVLSRRNERWTAGDQRLLGWAAREVSAALQRAYAFEAAETQAKRDPLTGLPNRRYLEEMVASLAPGRRDTDSIGALMIDIDYFKRLNDRFGHQVGDNVLRAVAEQIALAVRASDTPVRYGGEEFAVLLRSATPEQAEDVAERIRRAIATLDPALFGVDQAVTVSIGVAVGIGSHVDVPALLEEADRGLYRAKRLGRNQVARAA